MNGMSSARHLGLRHHVDVLLEALPVAVAAMNRDGIVRYGWNPAAENLFGCVKSEAIGRAIPLLDGECSGDFADLLHTRFPALLLQ